MTSKDVDVELSVLKKGDDYNYNWFSNYRKCLFWFTCFWGGESLLFSPLKFPNILKMRPRSLTSHLVLLPHH